MRAQLVKIARKARRTQRGRKHLRGSAERPRLAVTRSNTNVYVQIIDDDAGRTLCSASTRDGQIRATIGYGGNVKAAIVVGKAIAERAVAAGIKLVCFDRRGNHYHGRIKALADAAREAGLKF